MKAQNIMKSLVIAIILVAGVAQASAVDYRNSYSGIQSTEYRVQSGSVSAPAASFQSTSAYAAPEWAEQPMLNSDGTVNEGAYMGGRSNAPGPRRIESIGNPETDENKDGGNVPLGDALIPLMLCMCAYAIYKVSRRRKEA